MSAARIAADGKVTIVDGRAQAPEVVTEADVQEPPKLSRLLTRILRDVAELKRLFVPKRIDFEDITLPSGGLSITLQHNLGGRVRWWLVDFSTPGFNAPSVRKDTTNTTSNTLVLLSQTSGTATIRVESAG